MVGVVPGVALVDGADRKPVVRLRGNVPRAVARHCQGDYQIGEGDLIPGLWDDGFVWRRLLRVTCVDVTEDTDRQRDREKDEEPDPAWLHFDSPQHRRESS